MFLSSPGSVCAAPGRARLYQKARLLARYGHACLSADRCAIGPCILRMRAVMHEKRFALHGHKSTDGLNVEEEIGEELLHTNTIYTFHIGAESFMNVFFFTFF